MPFPIAYGYPLRFPKGACKKHFNMLKKDGLSAVNIDKLTEETYIAKGTFYNLFENKSEFMYHMMIHERNRAKKKLLS